jgi:hypothetical protein
MQEVNLQVNLDASTGKKTVKEVKDEIKAAEAEAKKLGGTLKDGISQAEGSAVNLKMQLRQMKAELQTLPEGSAEFKKLANAAGEVQDKLTMINNSIKSVADNKFNIHLQTLAQTGMAVGGAFQAAQGAMALFGSENEKIAKAIQNVIAIQGVMNGVQAVTNALQDDAILGMKLRTAWTWVVGAATKAWTAIQWALNAAITANPIGLIIVGVAALGAGIYLLVKNIKSVIAVFSDWKNIALALLGPFGWILIYMNEMDKAEKALASTREKQSKANTEQYNKRMAEIKAERDEQAKAHTDRQEQFDRQIARYEAEGKSSYALRLQKLEDIKAEKEAILQSNKDIIQATVDRYTVEAQLRGKSLEDFLTSIGLNYETQKAFLEDSLKDQEEAIYDADTNIIALKKEHNDKLKSEADKLAADEAAAKKKADEDEEARQRKQIEDQMELRKNADQLKLEQEQAQFDAEFDLLEEQIDRENAARELQAEQEKERRDKLFTDTVQSAENLIKITDSISTLAQGREFKRIKAKQEAGEKLTTSEIKRLKRAEAAEKARAIAQVAIDTARGISAAVAAGAGIPFPANIPAILSGVAAVLAGVAQAKSILGEGASTGGVSASDVTSGTDAIDNTANQTPNTIQAGSTFLNDEPTKVYVVESDITKLQKSVKVTEASATWG